MRPFYILYESLLSAYRTVVLNKLRTFLSLLGVTIGIVSIVSIFTVLDSMENNIRSSFETFGNNIVIVEKWPWNIEEGDEEYAWWEYMNRPVPTVKEYELLKEGIPGAAACFVGAVGATIEYLDRRITNTEIWGTSEEFGDIRSYGISSGRFFNSFEMRSGRNTCVIGSAIAEELFNNIDPLGKEITIRGKKATVIGIFEKEGSSAISGGSVDEVVLIPVGFLGTMVNLRQESSNPQIWVKPLSASLGVNELKINIRLLMRASRGLKLTARDNFAINQTSLMSAGIDQIFNMIGLAGWLIGIFAILIGGFGIANIMFVSVKERTGIIGIQKALGARNSYIILEVLYESVLLSVVGGVLGLLIIYAGTIIARSKDFEVVLGTNNIIFGILISTITGLVSGLLPAVTAARLDPVKAISSTF